MRVDMDHTQCGAGGPGLLHCTRQEEQVDISHDKQTVNRNSLYSPYTCHLKTTSCAEPE